MGIPDTRRFAFLTLLLVAILPGCGGQSAGSATQQWSVRNPDSVEPYRGASLTSSSQQVVFASLERNLDSGSVSANLAGYDLNGSPLWSVDNIYALTSYFQSIDGATVVDYQLSKLSSDGILLWQTAFRIPNQSYESQFQVDSRGNSYLAYVQSAPVLKKFNNLGEAQWEQTLDHDGSTVSQIGKLLIDHNDHAVVHVTSHRCL